MAVAPSPASRRLRGLADALATQYGAPTPGGRPVPATPLVAATPVSTLERRASVPSVRPLTAVVQVQPAQVEPARVRRDSVISLPALAQALWFDSPSAALPPAPGRGVEAPRLPAAVPDRRPSLSSLPSSAAARPPRGRERSASLGSGSVGSAVSRVTRSASHSPVHSPAVPGASVVRGSLPPSPSQRAMAGRSFDVTRRNRGGRSRPVPTPSTSFLGRFRGAAGGPQQRLHEVAPSTLSDRIAIVAAGRRLDSPHVRLRARADSTARDALSLTLPPLPMRRYGCQPGFGSLGLPSGRSLLGAPSVLAEVGTGGARQPSGGFLVHARLCADGTCIPVLISTFKRFIARAVSGREGEEVRFSCAVALAAMHCKRRVLARLRADVALSHTAREVARRGELFAQARAFSAWRRALRASAAEDDRVVLAQQRAAQRQVIAVFRAWQAAARVTSELRLRSAALQAHCVSRCLATWQRAVLHSVAAGIFADWLRARVLHRAVASIRRAVSGRHAAAMAAEDFSRVRESVRARSVLWGWHDAASQDRQRADAFLRFQVLPARLRAGLWTWRDWTARRVSRGRRDEAASVLLSQRQCGAALARWRAWIGEHRLSRAQLESADELRNTIAVALALRSWLQYVRLRKAVAALRAKRLGASQRAALASWRGVVVSRARTRTTAVLLLQSTRRASLRRALAVMLLRVSETARARRMQQHLAVAADRLRLLVAFRQLHGNARIAASLRFLEVTKVTCLLRSALAIWHAHASAETADHQDNAKAVEWRRARLLHASLALWKISAVVQRRLSVFSATVRVMVRTRRLRKAVSRWAVAAREAAREAHMLRQAAGHRNSALARMSFKRLRLNMAVARSAAADAAASVQRRVLQALSAHAECSREQRAAAEVMGMRQQERAHTAAARNVVGAWRGWARDRNARRSEGLRSITALRSRRLLAFAVSAWQQAAVSARQRAAAAELARSVRVASEEAERALRVKVAKAANATAQAAIDAIAAADAATKVEAEAAANAIAEADALREAATANAAAARAAADAAAQSTVDAAVHAAAEAAARVAAAVAKAAALKASQSAADAAATAATAGAAIQAAADDAVQATIAAAKTAPDAAKANALARATASAAAQAAANAAARKATNAAVEASASARIAAAARPAVAVGAVVMEAAFTSAAAASPAAAVGAVATGAFTAVAREAAHAAAAATVDAAAAAAAEVLAKAVRDAEAAAKSAAEAGAKAAAEVAARQAVEAAAAEADRVSEEAVVSKLRTIAVAQAASRRRASIDERSAADFLRRMTADAFAAAEEARMRATAEMAEALVAERLRAFVAADAEANRGLEAAAAARQHAAAVEAAESARRAIDAEILRAALQRAAVAEDESLRLRAAIVEALRAAAVAEADALREAAAREAADAERENPAAPFPERFADGPASSPTSPSVALAWHRVRELEAEAEEAARVAASLRAEASLRCARSAQADLVMVAWARRRAFRRWVRQAAAARAARAARQTAALHDAFHSLRTYASVHLAKRRQVTYLAMALADGPRRRLVWATLLASSLPRTRARIASARMGLLMRTFLHLVRAARGAARTRKLWHAFRDAVAERLTLKGVLSFYSPTTALASWRAWASARRAGARREDAARALEAERIARRARAGLRAWAALVQEQRVWRQAIARRKAATGGRGGGSGDARAAPARQPFHATLRRPASHPGPQEVDLELDFARSRGP
jgi:hypothetical protein